MLETMIKTVLTSFIIGFFLITCLRVINQSIDNTFAYVKHAQAINELDSTSFIDPETEGFRILIGEGSTITCKPKLINNQAGRVCVAS